MSGNNRVGIKDETYELVRKASAKKNVTMSVFADTILKEFAFEGKEHKVLFTIPPEVKRNKETLKEWLKVRMEAIYDSYYPSGKVKVKPVETKPVEVVSESVVEEVEMEDTNHVDA